MQKITRRIHRVNVEMLVSGKQEYSFEEVQFSLVEAVHICGKPKLISTNASQIINSKIFRDECSRNNPGFPEDLFRLITLKWRQRINQDIYF